MAAGGRGDQLMALRIELESALDALAGMLPVWQEKLREPAAFWPQFDALSREILVRARDDIERAAVRHRLEAILAANGLVRPQTTTGRPSGPPRVDIDPRGPQKR